ncbi:Membrane protein insertase MisCB [Microbacterium oxydans]|uniref:Membrane protein insertase YidC n=1 Tax=Microbacterium oxydans TaxID=82380 RepID=A0A0F0LEC3_9MICO|nr:YidC/Oxa1 family membrane protein insertase [Microbacterium oxydans]KJL29881.1 Membrane protein insertase MisCB precursor [Microbacterium oxydans]CAH0219207.1 Membrane protein insertase MisCB [Microbacterium oxydans]
MDPFALPPLTALLDAAYGALAGLSTLLEPFAGGAASAAAVILVTLLVRALLIPVGFSQAKAEQTRARLAPRLRELQRRHKKNPERLQRETLELYRSENTSPFAGMLPVLAQAPVVGILYTLFIRPEIAGHPNDLLTHDLFGAPLGTSLVSALFGGTATPATFLVFGVLLVIMLVVAEITRRVFRPAPVEGDSPLNSPTMLRVMSAMHYVTAVFAAFVPLAAALYLTVTVIWTLVQRALLRRRYPLPTTAVAANRTPAPKRVAA